MAKKKNESHIVRTYRTVARSELGLIVPSVLLIPAILAALIYMRRQLLLNGNDVEFMAWWWFAAPVAILLLFPLWAKFKTRFFSRYRVTLDSVVEEHGLFSKASSEIRIQDIRNIVVKQSFLDRVLRMGTVHFSSAAGNAVEVKFRKVAAPNKVKELVRDLQKMLSDGELSDAEVAEITEKANPRKKKPEAVGAGEAAARARAATPSKGADKGESTGAGAGNGKRASSSTESDGDGSSASGSSGAVQTAAGGSSSRPSSGASADDEARDELYRLLAEQEADGKAEQ